jgi:hypothetical protein
MKSNVSDYLEIMEAVYRDATMKCTADVSDLRDLETIRSRVKDEGLSFLTITLPKFCQAFEKALAFGFIDSHDFSGFRMEKHGSIPAFLQGMISQIFDRETGRMKNDDSPVDTGVDCSDYPTLVEGVRQICLTLKKIRIECTPERVQLALQSFVNTEQSFQMFSVLDEDISSFATVSFVLYSDLLRTITLDELLCKHGPGATADGRAGNSKYRWRFWHDRLEPYFPLIGNGYPLGTPSESEELNSVTYVPVDQELPVKVVTVPKTLKSPRIIAEEPCCAQFAQQAIKDELTTRLETYRFTSGHINFRDQTVNQKLALMASIHGRLATIDLSDASDRVPRDLALKMFDSNPDLRDAIDACRSTMAQLPDGRLVGPLMKFASMGSALCFPVEAMYFYAVCVVALLRAQSLPETPGNVFKVSRQVYVYGDDIIVPSTYADAVFDHLQKYNCKVNSNKTFFCGSFRESCGVDAFRGYEVTPTYITRECPKDRQQASEIISWVAAANHFYKKGYWLTAQSIFHKVEKVVGILPYVSETSPLLGRISFLSPRITGFWNRKITRIRFNRDYHSFEVKGLVSGPVYRTDELEGYGASTKAFLRLENKPDILGSSPAVGVSGSLDRIALHGAVTLKLRWATAH